MPIFGDSTIISNYIPISLLPVFSKTFKKKLVYGRLTIYFDKRNILSNYQFGFKKGNSTYNYKPISLLPVFSKIFKNVYMVD